MALTAKRVDRFQKFLVCKLLTPRGVYGPSLGKIPDFGCIHFWPTLEEPSVKRNFFSVRTRNVICYNAPVCHHHYLLISVGIRTCFFTTCVQLRIFNVQYFSKITKSISTVLEFVNDTFHFSFSEPA